MTSSKTILVVDDEPRIVELARDYLEHAGFAVLTAADGPSALATARTRQPDLVVLDLGLPGLDGLDVTRQLRTGERTAAVPIVMLTARDDELDKLLGLELGADDYLTKPFSPRELVARMKAVLRRAEANAEEPVLALGDVVLQRDAREVGVGGQPVELRPKEFDLLAFLMENRGVVVSRELLLERVWGFDYAGGTRTVDVHVAQLRRKLGRPELIQTIRGSGYKAVQP